jgi:hypothetical protein
MKLSLKNKRKFYSRLFIFAYLIYFGISLFHYHSIYLPQNFLCFQIENVTADDPYAIDHSNCLIIQLSYSQHDYYHSSLSITETLVELNQLEITYNNNFINQAFLNHNYLRAPPLFS